MGSSLYIIVGVIILFQALYWLCLVSLFFSFALSLDMIRLIGHNA
jgi:hypothetical protein